MRCFVPDSTDDDTYNPRDVEEMSSSSDERPPAKSKVGAIWSPLPLFVTSPKYEFFSLFVFCPPTDLCPYSWANSTSRLFLLLRLLLLG